MESSKSFKRKMLLWTSSWSQEDPPSTEKVPFTPNATEIASLLQAAGFHVRHMDRCLPNEMHPVPGVPADRPACRVILMCPKSGMRMELDAQTSPCTCPSPGDPRLPSGQRWSISEVESQETLRAAVDSTLQRPSSDVSKAVSQLIAGIFHVLSLLPDQNHNNASALAPAASTCGSSSPMKTPATGIAVVTPNAPCVPKASPEDSKTGIPGRYRSLDTLIASGGFADDLPEPGQLTPKDDADTVKMEIDGADLDSTIVQGPGSGKKKFFSKSSPAINCTEQFQRSGTFVFEDNDGAVDAEVATITGKRPLLRSDTYVSEFSLNNPEEDHPRAGPPPRRTPSPALAPSFSQSSLILSKLQEIQQGVSDVIFMVAGNEKNLSNIGDVSKASKAVAGALQRITDCSVRPIRCLSDFGSVPNLSRTSLTARSIPRLNSRRHGPAVAAPATPRTSRRGGTALTESVKKTSAAGTPGARSSAICRPNPNRLSIATPGSSLQKICASPSPSAANTSSVASAKDKDTSFDKRHSVLQSHIPKPGNIRK